MTEPVSDAAPKTDHPLQRRPRFNRRMTRLGELLRTYRVLRGLSTRAAAKDIGVTVSTLNRIESSDGGMTADVYLRISHWLLERSDSGSRSDR